MQKTIPAFQELQVRPLANRVLLAYLKERKVDISMAQKACKEVYFKQNGKSYFAIAFPNVSGGYEVRNKYFKGCIAPKDISCIAGEKKSNVCYLLGFLLTLFFLCHIHCLFELMDSFDSPNVKAKTE